MEAATRQSRMPAPQAITTPILSPRLQESPSKRRAGVAGRGGATGAGGGAAGRRVWASIYRACSVYLRIDWRATQPAKERKKLETSRIAAKSFIVCPTGTTESPSELSTIVAASVRAGSKKKVTLS